MDELTLDRCTLINPADEQLSLSQQCALSGLSRSSHYYQPIGESARNLALMERIDKLFTAPGAGCSPDVSRAKAI